MGEYSYEIFVLPKCLDSVIEATHTMFNNINSVAIKLIISGSHHTTITHLAPPLGLVLCIETDYLKFLENPLSKDTSI